MKKSILLLITLWTVINAFASPFTHKYSNGLLLTVEGCKDGSVSIEAKYNSEKNPMEIFEFKKSKDSDSFKKQDDNSILWKDYSLSLDENGYSLKYKDEELYSASFNIEKNSLMELRTWKTAEKFYGLGEASNKVNLSNQRFKIWNISKYGDHAYLYIPCYYTDSGTFVYYDAASNDTIYFQNQENCQSYTSGKNRIHCYVRQDENIQESVAKFYQETETSCMLPKWSYGFIQSKYGYKSSQEVMNLADTFEEKQIPLNAIVLDLYWFNKMGDISWTGKDFNDPVALDKYLEDKGIKLITITEPFYAEDSINYNELRKYKMLGKDKEGEIRLWRDWWCINGSKKGGIINPLAKKSTSFMGKKYYEMIQTGIDGFWTDLGEPESVPAETKLGKYYLEDFHNYYNYYWTKSLYDGIKEKENDRRIFIMSRSGWTGIGKFNVCVWSGDAKASWSCLEHQAAYGLNAGLSGLAYWGSDVGGFTPEQTIPELFVRWYQFGAFTPIFRAHGTDGREPWIFTEKEESIVTEYIRKRTEMLPYVYSTARQTMEGIPMMRPMFFAYPKVPEEYNETQFMFGDSILVCPVTKPMDNQSSKIIWLPQGNWYDFNTLKKIENAESQEIEIPLSIENIPVYIKEGAIIPCEKNNESCLFLIPSKNKSVFVLYNDDGITEQYKTQNKFYEGKIQLDSDSVKITSSGDKNFAPEEITLVIPSCINTIEGWITTDNIKTKKVTLNELEEGIQF